jgi:hypothetical protein
VREESPVAGISMKTLSYSVASIPQSPHFATNSPGGAAEAYATFMEQSALAVHWVQLHDNQYLLATPVQDAPGFAYKSQLIAHDLAGGGTACCHTRRRRARPCWPTPPATSPGASA